MSKIDLNCDLGESFGAYKIGADDAIMPYITSANIACGWHGGDAKVMFDSVNFAKMNDVCVGAHPGFPDLLGFGRRDMKISPVEAKLYVQYQVGALQAFCKVHGLKMQHVKLHGALYNMAAKDFKLAKSICEGIAELDDGLIILGLSNSMMTEAGYKSGIRVANEVFADRAYSDDGTLVPRSEENSVLHDSKLIAKRAVMMVKDKCVISKNGNRVDLKVDSICVHGDNEEAMSIVKEICDILRQENIEILPLNKIV